MFDSDWQDDSVEASDFGRQSDRPLDFHWRVPAEHGIRAGWLPSGNEKYDRSALSVMASLVMARHQDVEGWVSYSRRKDWYAKKGRYFGLYYSYGRVVAIVEELVSLKLAVEERASPGDHLTTKQQSRLRATDALLTAFEGTAFSYQRDEPLHLRDCDGNLVPYKETQKTTRMRSQLHRINHAYSRVELGFPEECNVVAGMVMQVERSTLRMTPRPILHRVFSRSTFEQGGRVYWWGQNLPKVTRSNVLMNGQPVVELDYKALHPMLLYAKVGAELPDDPYDVPGFDRDLAKRALLVLLNARGIGSAMGALMRSKRKDGSTWPLSEKETKNLVQVLTAKNVAIAHYFASDTGIRLQYLDSQIALRVIEACLREGIVALPVHDSFIVQQRHAEQTAQIMQAELQWIIDATPKIYLPIKEAKTVAARIPKRSQTKSVLPQLRPELRKLLPFEIDDLGCPKYDHAEDQRRLEAFVGGAINDYLPPPGAVEWFLFHRLGDGWITSLAESEDRDWRDYAFGATHVRPLTMLERQAGHRIEGAKPDWWKWLKPLLEASRRDVAAIV